MPTRRLDERAIIAMIRHMQNPPPAGYLGIGDDAAFVPGDSRGWLISQDMLVENTHFRWDWAEPEQVGRKAAEVNLSDIAAMGGTPVAALTSLALPPDTPFERVERLYRGLTEAFWTHGVVVLGGDTVGTRGAFVLDVTVIGFPSEQGPICRHGIQPGDRIFVTGSLGLSYAGYQLLEHRSRWPGTSPEEVRALSAHLEPKARVALGQALAPHVRTMTDVSDGLWAEVQDLMSDSGFGAEIWLDTLPISEDTRLVAARFDASPVNWALFGGEDYELMMTVPLGHVRALRQKAEGHGANVAEIGVITPAAGIRWLDHGQAVTVEGEGFNHFAH